MGENWTARKILEARTDSDGHFQNEGAVGGFRDRQKSEDFLNRSRNSFVLLFNGLLRNREVILGIMLSSARSEPISITIINMENVHSFHPAKRNRGGLVEHLFRLIRPVCHGNLIRIFGIENLDIVD
jgi:hypothetical protein